MDEGDKVVSVGHVCEQFCSFQLIELPDLGAVELVIRFSYSPPRSSFAVSLVSANL